MDKYAHYEAALGRAGLRMTEQRSVICAYLAETDLHPTPYQVHEEISRAHPEISRATVYNTLNTLQQLGAIVELSLGSDHTHYDTDPSPHINLICLRCHAITDDHTHLPLDLLQQRVADRNGFQVRTARVDILGLCAACMQAARNATETDLSHPKALA